MAVETLDIGGISEPLETTFSYGGIDYVVTEPSGTASSNHTERILKIAKPDVTTGKPTSIDGISLAEHPLIAECLFKIVDGGRAKVTTEEVSLLPNRITKSVFRWLRQVGKLDDEESSLKKS